MKTTYTFLKKNKALLILPLVLLPFVVLIFYILGGGENAGKENKSANEKADKTTGANYELPGADRSIEIFDKMEAYLQGKNQVIPTHDYNIFGDDSLEQVDSESAIPGDSTNVSNGKKGVKINTGVSDNLLAHIKNKERQVRKELEGNKQDTQDNQDAEKVVEAKVQTKPKPVGSPKPSKLDTGMRTGIEELDQVFDVNITLSRQNDSLSYYLKEANQKLKELEAKKSARFNLEKNGSKSFRQEEPYGLLIKAEVYETTTVLDGNRVKMRLLEACRVNGIVVPENTFIYGVCQVKNERLHIQVTQVPFQDNFLPVDLSIFDLDGLEGLYVPDNAARKVAKEVGSSTNTSSLFGVTTDPLTYAGVRAADKAAQSFLKTVRLKKVTIKKNTLVYLINQK